ncbi:ead/Ea22-like family protein [Escherichia coli]|uniref:ead/Ea22-like family protein n=1 Tax=Escherichia coli TaxID=562 RepID=UPI0010AB5CF4|nr:ead/Ea22-like family protein [Escherichia coli]EIG9378390.1 ead/Ea22-like family protein [Escherichia coli]EIO1045437.1 ead/Ea22-like family protein [Escherichia coli]EIO1054078.1 ead/Ea22-like family protein [Escherichia coli]EIO1075274.1 ead/Ea22-like family protein [Escherichia coli]EIO1123485.1 ead/Ea22-like family protein [Escherichia coli]
MTIDYQALREVAEAAKGDTTWQNLQAFHAAATPEVVLALLDVLDASLEAEPVAWTDEEELRDVRKYGFGEIFQCPPDKYADPRRVISLYREPPAVPAVLERLRAIVSDPRALPRRKEWVSGQQYSYVLLENVEAMVDEACRTAMLQGKGE